MMKAEIRNSKSELLEAQNLDSSGGASSLNSAVVVAARFSLTLDPSPAGRGKRPSGFRVAWESADNLHRAELTSSGERFSLSQRERAGVRERNTIGDGDQPELAPARQTSRSAFTLLELLLAILVFAIVLSAIHVVFFTALRLRDRTSDAIERSLPLQQSLGIIKRDLANLVPPGGTLAGQLQSTPTVSTPGNSMNRANGPQFHTAVGVVSDYQPWGEIQRVSYFLGAPTNAAPGMDLFRSVTRNLLPATQDVAEDQFLMSGVDSITFQYYDGNNWKDTWDSTVADTVTGLTNNLPRAIKVVLALATEGQSLGTPAPVELIVPILVLQRTNFVTTVGGAQ